MIYLSLYWEFFKIGLFAVGGGLATLPFLQDLAVTTGWYSTAFLSDMIAISESTPGPIGINMATYVGCNVAGFWGGVVATLGEITPSLLIVTLICQFVGNFSSNPKVEAAFYGLRPAVTGLIAAAGLSMAQVSLLKSELLSPTDSLTFLSLIAWDKFLFFTLVTFALLRVQKHPVVYIAGSAIVGILFF